jgi:hypothetical protein
MTVKKLPKGEKQIQEAVRLVNKLVHEVVDETTDEDIKYELGKAWGIVKEYLNINEETN